MTILNRQASAGRAARGNIAATARPCWLCAAWRSLWSYWTSRW